MIASKFTGVNNAFDGVFATFRYALLAEHLFGTSSLRGADARNILALYYYKTRRYERALVEAEKVLNVRKEKLGDFWRVPPHPRVAESYTNLGLLQRLTGMLCSF